MSGEPLETWTKADAPSNLPERRALWFVIALAVLLRLLALAEPMRFDEAITYLYFVAQPWRTALSWYPFPNNHLLYTALAKLLAPLAPMQPWAVRLPAFIAGCAVVPLAYLVGARFVGRSAALLGAAFACGSTTLTLYSANARGYSIVTALFLLLLLLAARLRERASLLGWGLFAVAGALGGYAIPTMLFPYGVVGTWLTIDALSRRTRDAWRTLAYFALASVVAAALATAAYLPVLIRHGLEAVTANRFVRPQKGELFWLLLPAHLKDTLTNWASPLPTIAAPMLFVAALAGILWHHRQPRKLPSLAHATWLSCGALLLVSHRVPFVRVWQFLLPLYGIACGIAIAALLRWRGWERFVPWCAAAAAAGLAILSLATKAVAYPDTMETLRSAPQVTAILKERLKPGDRVLAPNPTYGPLLFYFVEQGVDTTFLTVPMPPAHRAYVVLAPRAHRTLDWLVSRNILDVTDLPRIQRVASFEDAELWTIDDPLRVRKAAPR